MVRLEDLGEREILALAIASEEEDGHIYADFAAMLEEKYPGSAVIFREMAAEEDRHRRGLIELYQERFGNHIPLIRRSDVRGFQPRRSPWRMRSRDIDSIRGQAAGMERQAARFYRQAASQTQDAEIRRLLGDLARTEEEHCRQAFRLEESHVPVDVRRKEAEASRRDFLLRVVQPGLVGLMDGSVSTLAPVFAAAFATMDSFRAFQVGLAASLGAAISMGLAEGLADDGKLSGRGAPLARGVLCGAMTFSGGIGHTLPFLIPAFRAATGVAIIVVAIELCLISWVRWRYQDASFVSAFIQVMFGGILVFATGILIGVG